MHKKGYKYNNERSKKYNLIVLLFILVGIIMSVFVFASEVRAETPQIFYLPLEKKLQQYLETQPGMYGLFVADIKTWSSFGINAEKKFVAASTVKLPVALYVLHLVEAGELSLAEQLEYMEKHKEGGTGYLKKEELGSKFSVSRLVRDSIIYSDNVAVNMLLDHVGRKNTKEYMRRMGGRVVDDVENVTCPIDMALYMARALAFAREKPKLGGKLMNYLFNTVYNQRIPAPLPQEVRVAHKIGNWPLTGTFNDVGYVEHPVNPYIIAILSKETPGREEAFRVIRHISREVYDYQDSPYYCAEVILNGKKLPMKDCALFRGGWTKRGNLSALELPAGTPRPAGMPESSGGTASSEAEGSAGELELLVPLRSFTEAVPELELKWVEETRQIIVMRKKYPAKCLVYALSDEIGRAHV